MARVDDGVGNGALILCNVFSPTALALEACEQGPNQPSTVDDGRDDRPRAVLCCDMMGES